MGPTFLILGWALMVLGAAARLPRLKMGIRYPVSRQTLARATIAGGLLCSTAYLACAVVLLAVSGLLLLWRRQIEYWIPLWAFALVPFLILPLLQILVLKIRPLRELNWGYDQIKIEYSFLGPYALGIGLFLLAQGLGWFALTLLGGILFMMLWCVLACGVYGFYVWWVHHHFRRASLLSN